MFHDGDLQSGISLAISQQKSVACFVRDDTSESSKWEQEWLPSPELADLLVQTTVLLRLEAGSTEAGFLAAFCPVSQTPTLVVIYNGQLRDQLVSGVTKDEFITRLRKAVSGDEAETGEQPSGPAQSGGTATAPVVAQQEQDQIQQPSRIAADTETRPAPTLPTSKGKGKQKVVDNRSKPPISPSVQNEAQKAREIVRRQKQEQDEERRRIQARIEADKAERKAQAEARKAERKREEQQSPHTPQSAPRTSSKSSLAKEVRLNVRLFDGHTIRSTFPRTATLQDDVRPWIDECFAAKAESPSERLPPYIFKQIIAPLPSRELSASDESAALGDIDLAPSATLVLIPMKGYVDAYGASGGGIVGTAVNGVTNLVSGALGLLSSAVGFVGGSLGSFMGHGSSSDPQTQSHTTGNSTTSNTQNENPGLQNTIRVRTLADQRAGERENQQFYNGNQLDFEPNPDEGASSGGK
jgi:hypothetical protein